jgi:hypothetical protein
VCVPAVFAGRDFCVPMQRIGETCQMTSGRQPAPGVRGAGCWARDERRGMRGAGWNLDLRRAGWSLCHAPDNFAQAKK